MFGDNTVLPHYESHTVNLTPVSRVMQVWRSMVVRDRLLADDASAPFLQRQHFQLRDTGYARAAAASAGPKGVPPSVFEKVKEGRDNA